MVAVTSFIYFPLHFVELIQTGMKFCHIEMIYWKRETSRGSRPDIFCELDVLKNWQILQESNCGESFFSKVLGFLPSFLGYLA